MPGWLIFRLADVKRIRFLKQIAETVWNIFGGGL